MEGFEERVEQSTRRGSAVEIIVNPLDPSNNGLLLKEAKVETTNDAVPINAEQLMEIIAVLLSKG